MLRWRQGIKKETSFFYYCFYIITLILTAYYFRKCEESEDRLRSEMIQSLEKLATSTKEREEAPSCSKNAEKPGEKERLNLPARNSSEGLEFGLSNLYC